METYLNGNGDEQLASFVMLNLIFAKKNIVLPGLDGLIGLACGQTG